MISQPDLSARAAALLARLEELRSMCEAAPSPLYRDKDDCGVPSLFHGRPDAVSHLSVMVGFHQCCVPVLDLAVAACTTLPILVRIGIAEVERAQEMLSNIGKWPSEGPRWAEEVADILDTWSPILEAAEKP